MTRQKAYHTAQRAMADLKAAVYALLMDAGDDGATNASLGRQLGIYGGHVGHEGHISRTILALLEADGVVEQDPESKLWRAPANAGNVTGSREQG